MGQTSWAQPEAMGSPSKPRVDWRMHCAETGFSEYHRSALNPASVPTPLPVQAEVAQQCAPGPGGLGPCELPTNGWDETLCPQKVGSRSQPCGHHCQSQLPPHRLLPGF